MLHSKLKTLRAAEDRNTIHVAGDPLSKVICMMGGNKIFWQGHGVFWKLNITLHCWQEQDFYFPHVQTSYGAY
jgi:hypothetical protein